MDRKLIWLTALIFIATQAVCVWCGVKSAWGQTAPWPATVTTSSNPVRSDLPDWNARVVERIHAHGWGAVLLLSDSDVYWERSVVSVGGNVPVCKVVLSSQPPMAIAHWLRGIERSPLSGLPAVLMVSSRGRILKDKWIHPRELADEINRRRVVNPTGGQGQGMGTAGTKRQTAAAPRRLFGGS